MSEASVKKALAEEDAKFLKEGGRYPHATTAAQFVSIGLELEEAQYVLHLIFFFKRSEGLIVYSFYRRRLRRIVKTSTNSSTVRKESSITEQRNTLLTRIRAWESLQLLYMPGLLQYRTDHPHLSSDTSEESEDHFLWLPSKIPEPHRKNVCNSGLEDIEERLRTAHCSDALDDLRRILRIKSRMVLFKNKNARGQREGTRSRAVIDRVHERARNAAERYHASRVAKLALTGPGDWETLYRVLEDGDIRGYQDAARLKPRKGRKGTLDDAQLAALEAAEAAEMDVDSDSDSGSAPAQIEELEVDLLAELRARRDGTGETRRTLSWIWTSGQSSGEEDKSDELLRSEWAKHRARAARTKEEVLLLKEEMRRVLAFLDWKATWWKERQELRSEGSKELVEAIRAYAIGQETLQKSLAKHFRTLWKSPLEEKRVDTAEGEDEQGIDGQERDDDDDDDEDDEGDHEGRHLPDDDDIDKN